MRGFGKSPMKSLSRLPAYPSLFLTLGLAAQAPPQNPAEMATREEPATFKARVNLVLVPVVVRDRQGRALGNLKQEGFQLFDKGKSQVIMKCSIEKSAGCKGRRRTTDGSPERRCRDSVNGGVTCSFRAANVRERMPNRS
jgi:hypothetical protein